MRKILKLLLLILVVAAGLFFIFMKTRPAPVRAPKTTIRMYEGSASVYRIEEISQSEYLEIFEMQNIGEVIEGEPSGIFPGAEIDLMDRMEYMGILRAGESMEVSRKKMDPAEAINVMKWLIPQAIGRFKKVIAGFSINQSVGVHDYFFTQEDFDVYISSKLRKRFWPDLAVRISPDGYTATGTLTVGDFKAPFYSTGLVGVDREHYGKMYAKIYDVGIGGAHVPPFVRDTLQKATNAVINKGSYAIEIRDMKYRDGGIDITYYKKEAAFRKKEEETISASDNPMPDEDQKAEEMLKALETVGGKQ